MWVKANSKYLSGHSEITGEPEFEEDFIVFRVSEISSFNPSDDSKYTTIIFKNGINNVVEIEFDKFCKMLNDSINANII